MITESCELDGVLLIRPPSFADERGRFQEAWREDAYREAGIRERFVQDNISFSRAGVLRGLHYQLPKAQGKLVSVPFGEVFDVAVDIRWGSPSFGKWFGTVLSSENGAQLYVPPGFAHGFMALSDEVVLTYKCSEYYDGAGDASLRWNDPDISVSWPDREPVLSPKDAAAPLLRDLDPGSLPAFEAPASR